MRVGFLFNHDQIHQVAHSLPIAAALAKNNFAGEIVVATTNDRLEQEVRRLVGPLLRSRIEHVALSLSGWSSRLDGLAGKFIPSAKVLIYRDNLDFFRSLDILVVSEKTSLILKSRYGLNRLAIVHTRHGAGDRAIGFDKASAGFDHVLCSGPKIRDRLIADAGVAPEAISIIGYPKFDLVENFGQRFFPDDAGKVVLYNPHPSPHLSSWYRHGWQVIDQFIGNTGLALIFAPHLMLFERKFVLTVDRLSIDRPGTIPQRYLEQDNIRVDLGSRASTDMSYTLGSDIYLGDASSQVYEFLYRPRPCIFLNSHGHAWRGDPNFRHWQTGEVISDPKELPAALERAQDLHNRQYRPIQEQLFAESFDLSDTPSSVRAARKISDLAEKRGSRRTAKLQAVP